MKRFFLACVLATAITGCHRNENNYFYPPGYIPVWTQKQDYHQSSPPLPPPQEAPMMLEDNDSKIPPKETAEIMGEKDTEFPPKETPLITEDQDLESPPTWVPAGRLSRRIDRPNLRNQEDEWEKISPWIYR